MHGLEKIYGLYNMKDNEQCEYFGTKKEIAEYLGLSYSYLGSYLTRKKQGTQELLKHKYDLVEMEKINEWYRNIRKHER